MGTAMGSVKRQVRNDSRIILNYQSSCNFRISYIWQQLIMHQKRQLCLLMLLLLVIVRTITVLQKKNGVEQNLLYNNGRTCLDAHSPNEECREFLLALEKSEYCNEINVRKKNSQATGVPVLSESKWKNSWFVGINWGFFEVASAEASVTSMETDGFAKQNEEINSSTNFKDTNTRNDSKGKQKTQSNKEFNRILMVRHSWQAPLTYENQLDEWHVDGSAVPTTKQVVLVPAVENRTGHLWSKMPILTDNFDITATFYLMKDMAKENSSANVYDGQVIDKNNDKNTTYDKLFGSTAWAIWYIYDNMTDSLLKWDVNLDNHVPSGAMDKPDNIDELKFFGYNNNLLYNNKSSAVEGFGVFFSINAQILKKGEATDQQEMGKTAQVETGAESQGRVWATLFDKSTGKITVDGSRCAMLLSTVTTGQLWIHLSISTRGITGYLAPSTNQQYNFCFFLPFQNIRPGGFIGFSAKNAPRLMSIGNRNFMHKSPILISLRSVYMYNLNVNVIGESLSEIHTDSSVTSSEPSKTKRQSSPSVSDDSTTGSPSYDLMKKLQDLVAFSTKIHTAQHRAQAIHMLSGLLKSYSNAIGHRERRISTEINKINVLLQSMLREVRDIKHELLDSNISHPLVDAIHSVKSEFSGLLNLFHRHSSFHNHSLNSLSSTISAKLNTDNSRSSRSSKELQELTNRAASLEEILSSNQSFYIYMILGAFSLLSSLALFVWKKFRDMEKKHYL